MSRPGQIHPLAILLPVATYVVALFVVHIRMQFVLVAIAAILTAGLGPRTEHDPARVFLRLSAVAAVLLGGLHAVAWNQGASVTVHGLEVATSTWLRLVGGLTAVLLLLRSTSGEAIYALLADCRMPPTVAFVTIGAVGMTLRLISRANEVLLAQQLRGFESTGLINRIRAYRILAAPLLSSTFYELEDTAAGLAARGLRIPGRKTHLVHLRFGLTEASIAFGSTVFLLWAILSR